MITRSPAINTYIYRSTLHNDAALFLFIVAALWAMHEHISTGGVVWCGVAERSVV